MRTQYDQADVRRAVDHLAAKIAAAFDPAKPLVVVGIRTRGHTLADWLSELLRRAGYSQIGRGVLDITLYRDDLSEIGPRPMVRPTPLQGDIDGKPLLLGGDVLF